MVYPCANLNPFSNHELMRNKLTFPFIILVRIWGSINFYDRLTRVRSTLWYRTNILLCTYCLKIIINWYNYVCVSYLNLSCTFFTALSGSSAMSGTEASTISENRFNIKFACLKIVEKRLKVAQKHLSHLNYY